MPAAPCASLPCHLRAIVVIDDLPLSAEAEVCGKAGVAATTFCMLHAKDYFALILLFFLIHKKPSAGSFASG
jgi:hypothetical protein